MARREQLDYTAFLQIILTDEVTRREQRRLEVQLQKASFEELCRLEDFDWRAPVTLDRRRPSSPWTSWPATSMYCWSVLWV